MFCSKCGVEIPENSAFCAYCGTSQTGEASLSPKPVSADYAQQAYPQINSHLVGAVLVTLFCCLPFGIVSIVYASRVAGLVATKQLDEAYATSQKAATWMWWGFGIGIIAQIIGIAIHIVIGVAEAMAETGSL